MYPDAVIQTLLHVTESLERLSVPCALCGGLAVSNWKHLRTTHDVAIRMASDVITIDSLLTELANQGLRPKRHPPVLQIGDCRFASLLHEPPKTFLDIQVDLLFADTEFQQQSLRRRQSAELPGTGH